MQRVAALALLNNGQTTIFCPGLSNDDLASLDIVRQFGAAVDIHPEFITISSSGQPARPPSVHCGESGLSIRMFAPIAALSADPVVLEAEGSLLKRDLSDIKKVLEPAGISVQLHNGHAPVQIKGPLISRNIEVDGSGGSQVLTGLMMAYSCIASEQTSITVSSISSRPYLHLTAYCMERFGRNVTIVENEISVSPAAGTGNRKISIEGDWSNGAFLCVAAAINGSMFIKGLDESSRQGDKAIIGVLKESGVECLFVEGGLVIKAPGELHPFSFDATHYPDLFPPLVALALKCNGVSRIKGLHRLKNKESDRMETLLDVIAKFKGDAHVEEDELLITGGATLRGANVHSFNDHRIVMLGTVLATVADGDTTISDAEAVDKSWPDFFDTMKRVKAIIHSRYE